jgi:Protein of unknown function (DUF3128)
MQPKEVVDVFGVYASEWSKCLTAKYQRDQMYRIGKFDDCSRQWKDVLRAMKAKFMTDTDEATQYLQKETYYYKSTTQSPTVGIIWDLKENPGWD